MKVNYKELDYPGDGLHYHNKRPFTGVALYLSQEGWIQAEEEYVEGLLSGWKREWHGPEVLACEAQTALGVRHGFVREWDQEGRLEVEHTYEHGIRVSSKHYDGEGQLVEEFHLQETDPSFRILQATRAAHPDSEKA